MAERDEKRGLSASKNISDVNAAMRKHSGALILIAIFSAFMNLLMLTGPVFMLQVYDRVLSSHSTATLTVLLSILVFLFVIMGLLDHVRGRMLARIGAAFQEKLDERVFVAVLKQSELPQYRERPASGLRDLSTIQGLLASPLPGALFDLPWTPLFLAVLFMFHPWIGWFSIGGGIILYILALINQKTTDSSVKDAGRSAAEADALTEATRRENETIRGLGMGPEAIARWRISRDSALTAQMVASDRGSGLGVTIKIFRLILQSAVLGLGALLVLRMEMTAGGMIAASILLGRALAPIEQLVGQWSSIQKGMQSWKSLDGLLRDVGVNKLPMALPRPESRIIVSNVAIVPAGERKIVLQGMNFEVQPGEAVAVIGPSAAGKSTLARAISGVWPIAAGEIRLGGAELSQYDPAVLGRLLGYLPQDVVLFDATIAENIARLSKDAKPEDIVEAAKQAGAHELILAMPQGYETPVSVGGAKLSGGQRQRIGLARALYGNPVALILDEPNAALDENGVYALNQAILRAKEAGLAVIVMSHRPSALAECDKVVLIERGRQRAFGPRDEVLKQFVKNQVPASSIGSNGRPSLASVSTE